MTCILQSASVAQEIISFNNMGAFKLKVNSSDFVAFVQFLGLTKCLGTGTRTGKELVYPLDNFF
jgi:hypothetical protein